MRVAMFAVTAASCATPPSPVVANTRSAQPVPSESSEVLASIEAYYDRSRIFSFVVYQDGRVVHHLGWLDITRKLAPGQLARLEFLFAAAGYFDLADEYRDPSVSDGAIVITRYRHRGQEKWVKHDVGDHRAPAALSRLENSLWDFSKLFDLVPIAR
jgi:hypothetical protein